MRTLSTGKVQAVTDNDYHFSSASPGGAREAHGDVQTALVALLICPKLKTVRGYYNGSWRGCQSCVGIVVGGQRSQTLTPFWPAPALVFNSKILSERPLQAFKSLLPFRRFAHPLAVSLQAGTKRRELDG